MSLFEQGFGCNKIDNIYNNIIGKNLVEQDFCVGNKNSYNSAIRLAEEKFRN